MTPIPNFTEIRSVGAELINSDQRRYLTDAFRENAKAPKNLNEWKSSLHNTASYWILLCDGLPLPYRLAVSLFRRPNRHSSVQFHSSVHSSSNGNSSWLSASLDFHLPQWTKPMKHGYQPIWRFLWQDLRLSQWEFHICKMVELQVKYGNCRPSLSSLDSSTEHNQLNE